MHQRGVIESVRRIDEGARNARHSIISVRGGQHQANPPSVCEGYEGVA